MIDKIKNAFKGGSGVLVAVMVISALLVGGAAAAQTELLSYSTQEEWDADNSAGHTVNNGTLEIDATQPYFTSDVQLSGDEQVEVSVTVTDTSGSGHVALMDSNNTEIKRLVVDGQETEASMTIDAENVSNEMYTVGIHENLDDGSYSSPHFAVESLTVTEGVEDTSDDGGYFGGGAGGASNGELAVIGGLALLFLVGAAGAVAVAMRD